MKIGLIGCGKIGLKHCRAIKDLSAELDIEVAALADVNCGNLSMAATYWPEARRYSQGMELITGEGVDVVYICLPSFLHTEHALAAMARGADVFIEKPVCLTKSDCNKLITARNKYNRTVVVGHVVRFMEEYSYLKKVYDSGSLGKLKSLVMSRVCSRVEDWLYHEEKSGTVILDLHIHDVDFLRWMLGEPVDADVCALKGIGGIVTHIQSKYRFGEVFVNTEAVWDISSALPFEASYRAHFERGTLVYNSRSTPALTLYLLDGTVITPEPEWKKTEDRHLDDEIESHRRECQYFVRAIQSSGSSDLISLDEGVKSVELALCILEKAKAYIQQH